MAGIMKWISNRKVTKSILYKLQRFCTRDGWYDEVDLKFEVIGSLLCKLALHYEGYAVFIICAAYKWANFCCCCH